MSELASAELLATCNSLGFSDGEKYYKDPDCLASLTDLIRFLKHDEDNHEVRRQLGRMQVMQSDLIWLLKILTNADKHLLNVLVRLMVDLLMPALIVHSGEIPADSFARKNYLEIVSHLQAYKLAFCATEVWKAVADRLRDFLSLDWENRLEDDILFIERLLVLVRNILHVPVNPTDELRTDDDVSVHDRILWEMHKAGLDDLILFLVNSDEYQEFCMHSLEIISLMLREQDPGQLTSSGAARSLTDKQKDVAALNDLRQKEAVVRKAKLATKNILSYPRFRGSFCVKGVKSVSDRELIIHEPVSDLKAVNFDKNKNAVKKPKNRNPLQDTSTSRQSTLSIRLFLRDICTEFLSSAYNSIMRVVKDQLNRSSESDHDESYYLWTMRFFMEFNRLGDFKVELVSETMSVATFHYIQTQLDRYHEMMKVDKPKWFLWSKRLHLALRAYKELIMTLQTMDCASDENVRKSAKVMKTNLFYMNEYRDLPCDLFIKYNEVTMPKTYLKDLVELTHVFVKMLEDHVKVYSNLIVQKKKRKSNIKSKSKAKKPTKNVEINDSLDVLWEKTISELQIYINDEKELPDGIMPFDPASEIPVEDQKATAVVRIQRFIKVGKGPEALSLLHAAREVWPEGDVFGANNEADTATLKEILMAKLPNGGFLDGVPCDRDEENEAENAENEVEEEINHEEEDEEEEIARTATGGRSEQQLDFDAFIMR
ncbi:hypothetical protein CHUAL_010434 [Chamberlinius hualienensis]